MESDRGENLNSEVEDPLPDFHEAKGTLVYICIKKGDTSGWNARILSV